MQIQKQDLITIKLLSSKEWQVAYKNFAYQNSTYFSDNLNNQDQQLDLFKKYQVLLGPIADKYLTKEEQDQQKINIKQILTENPQENVVQLLSLFDFNIFQADMISQNQLLDLIALELIRKEVKQELNESSSDDEEAENDYFEQERLKAKQNIEGKADIFEKKKELENTIRETIANFNLPEVMKQPDILVDQYGFNQGVAEKEDDIFKKSIKLRTIKLKQTVPKKEIKLTTEELKKRRLQMAAVRKVIKEI